ncbi:MAG: ATPase [Archangium gephyra]|uniref:arsenite-transporting ATPase n=1 Tax=Archangium gephyra TaxID=48 RepID=A0A2W5UH37_9BACT|nr:MAG: ATPase [Archangium gephyra]
MNPIREAVEASDVLVTVGSGGVGKTTVAASLALRAALEGQGSLVCTIDPARRLANSLGLDALGNAEMEISAATFEQAGLKPKAVMRAMMLDMKRTWDDLIIRHAPADKRDKILANRFYQSLSTALAGSQEYVAMEKLWELRTQRDYPLIVLDTPPTAHALDFLDAPNRLLDFMDNDAAKWLLTPALAAGKIGLKLFNLGGSYVTKTISRFTGTETLQQLADFMLNISGMNEGFKERARQTRALLEADSTSFVLVTGPMPERLDETVHFHTLLKQNKMKVAAIVVNRVHAPVPASLWEEVARLPPDRQKKFEATLKENEQQARQDARGVERLREACEGTPLVLVPRFEHDVHDLRGLYETSHWLWGEQRLELSASAR